MAGKDQDSQARQASSPSKPLVINLFFSTVACAVFRLLALVPTHSHPESMFQIFGTPHYKR